MAVPQWKVEHQHRYLSVETGDYYYWTTVYYYTNYNSDPSAGTPYNALLNATYGGSVHSNELVAIRVTHNDTGLPYGIATPAVNNGLLPDLDGGSLNNIIRLTGWGFDGIVSYKLWRPPLQIADIEGGQLSDGMWSVVQDTIIPALDSALLQNVQGEVVQGWTADRRIHGWQLRHGTNRRVGPVFAYP